MSRRKLGLEILEQRRVLDSTVVFNELMYEPRETDGTGTGEWVELYNQMSVDMDLSAWSLDGGIAYTFPEGTIVPGGGFVVIAAEPGDFRIATGIADVHGPFVGNLANGGERLELRDRTGRLMNTVDYRDGGSWPVAAAGSGATLAKLSPTAASELASNWTFSPTIGGTPAAENFPNANTPPTSLSLITLDSVWRYLDSGVDLGSGWRSATYNDTAWPTGQSLFYAGDGHVATSPGALITGVSVIASSQYPGREGINTVNGSGLSGDSHSTDVGAMWLSNGTLAAPHDTSPSITFDLGSIQAIDHMRLWNYNEYRPDLPSRVAELLGRGIHRADILVSSDNITYTPWKLNHSFTVVTPATSNFDFSQTVDFSGVSARYVRIDIHSNHNGKEFNNPTSDDGLGNFAGLSEVQFYATGDQRKTELAVGPQAYYFRQTFAFAGEPVETQLFLNAALDDGAVYYVNGTEVHRSNMPNGTIGYSTLASSEITLPQYSGIVEIPRGALVKGQNVLAVEVHQAAQTDNDMVFGAELSALVFPPTIDNLSSGLAFNEVATGGAADFFVEVINQSDVPLASDGVQMVTSLGRQYTFPSMSLPAGQLLAITSSELGFTPTNKEKLFLVNLADARILDAVEVETTPQARSTDTTAKWLRPDVATPGAMNHFSIHGDIVINEIMYHHRPDYEIGEDAGGNSSTLLVSSSQVWKYNRTGVSLPANWYATDYTVDNTAWRSGAGPIGVESATLEEPIRTTWSGYDSNIVTYYFQKDFTFSGADPSAEILLEYLIDDGAVFYLNGHELVDHQGNATRFNMGAGQVNSTTLANNGVADATYSAPIVLSPDQFNLGTNTLSVEVHQSSTGSSDMVFGLRLSLREADNPNTGAPYRENDEEWIELHNRGNAPVDLAGWRLDNAIDYTFGANTILGPGEFLVVANDAASLRMTYDDANIVGNFSGSLNNTTDTIILRDAFGNPADEVTYFDDGRWPVAADGGGASLELRNPWSDNSVAESWGASDETSNTSWETYSYSGVVTASTVGNDSQWREFLLGLLDAGELLLDDITVTRLSGTAGSPLIANSTFEADTIGMEPAGWRVLGNHRHATVIQDPEDPNNQVLRLLATGPTEHMHNHVETTLTGGQSIQNGQTYEVSFRARWISGSPQLHSRFYFNRLPHVTVLEQPARVGTPGTVNSVLVNNVGPTYDELNHSPAVPEPNQPVTISVTAADPDGVASMTLWYSIAGNAWNTAPMTGTPGNRYTGIIPGQSVGTIVQFFVSGTDAHPVTPTTSLFPALGPGSRALYKVNDGLASDTGIHNLRIILTPDDANWLHTDINLMSNDRVGGTVIYNENEIFYNIGVRLSGSQRARPYQPRLSFNIEFNNEQLFRGVHHSIALDRSDSTGFGQREILLHHAMGHAGTDFAEYNDLVNIMTPRLEHTGGAELQMARYTDVFVDAQYDRGGDGKLYEYELIYYPTTANAQGYKLPQPDSVAGTAIRNLGDNEESYRWNFLIKSQRDEDSYARLIEWAKIMGSSGTAFNSQIGSVIDVDQWMRAAAFAAASGFGDNYGAGDQHNAQFFIRPEDNRVLYFPHDLDAFFDRNRGILAGNEIAKIVIASPANRRSYYGHMLDIVTTTYNGTYMAHFANNYKSLLPGQPYDSWLSDIAARANVVLSQINAAIPQVTFGISTAGPINAGNLPTVNVSGTGWINVRELRLTGSDVPLETTWNSTTGWTAAVPVHSGMTSITIGAYDYQGESVGIATVAVNSTATNPLVASLRISELNYHPTDPTNAELTSIAGLTDNDFEFLEFHNIGNQDLNLLNVHFESGITYSLPSYTLPAGERAVIVANLDAFRLRYGASIPVIGEWTGGRLANEGERIALVTPTNDTILDFAYQDGGEFPEWPDGVGGSLELRDTLATDTRAYSKGRAWQGSVTPGGSPGAAPSIASGVVINELRSGSSVELFNTSADTIDISGWYLSSDQTNLRQFRVPDDAQLPPGGYLVFDESDFGADPTGGNSSILSVGLQGAGELWLTIADASGNVVALADEVHYEVAPLGYSWSRYPNGAGQFAATRRVTLGCANAEAFGGEVVISEIQYHAGEPSAIAKLIDPTITASDLEFIEIHNPSNASVNLGDWRIRGGIDFDFPAGTMLPADKALIVVPFNPLDTSNEIRLIAFRVHYNLDPTTVVLGGYSGQLNNDSERIRLERPVAGSLPKQWSAEEIVWYDDVAPWTTEADGTGNSLQRRAPVFYANDPHAWRGQSPTPGVALYTGNVRGDLNGDTLINALDLDALFTAFSRASQVALWDLDNSGTLDKGDIDYLLADVLQTKVGDANLDGRVDDLDFAIWYQARHATCMSSWSNGDFNGDGVVDVRDYNLWNANRDTASSAAVVRQTEAVFSTTADRRVAGRNRLGRSSVQV
ncbi:MAG: lamin tail domain-containing protein [Pirellulaceae bacterium]